MFAALSSVEKKLYMAYVNRDILTFLCLFDFAL